MYGSAGQSWKYTLPMTIMQKGMTTVMLQAMVQPMVPSSSRITFTTKSTTFLEALCVSRILPNSESYEGGSAVAHKTSQKMNHTYCQQWLTVGIHSFLVRWRRSP